MTYRRMLAFALTVVVAATAPRAAAAQAANEITCESRNDGYRYCPIVTRGTARVTRQLSDAACILDRTWGFDARGIWVDRGCRARFAVAGSGGGWTNTSSGQQVTCESEGGRYEFCPVMTRNDVRLLRQLSQAPCVAGRTWGFRSDGIWVTEGCRAEFELGFNDASWEGGVRQVRCESEDRRYRRCRTWTFGEVRLVRTLSSARCVLRSTWGWDQDGIWVTDGCRGIFDVGTHPGGGGWSPGDGGPVGGASWDEIRRLGIGECSRLARQRGFSAVTTQEVQRRGAQDVWVRVRGTLGRQSYDLSCYYSASQRRAEVLGQQLVGGGNSGNNGVEGSARQACTAAVTRQGFTDVRTVGVQRSGNEYLLTQEARIRGRDYRIRCRYTIPTRQVEILEQTQLPRAQPL